MPLAYFKGMKGGRKESTKSIKFCFFFSFCDDHAEIMCLNLTMVMKMSLLCEGVGLTCIEVRKLAFVFNRFLDLPYTNINKTYLITRQ